MGSPNFVQVKKLVPKIWTNFLTALCFFGKKGGDISTSYELTKYLLICP